MIRTYKNGKWEESGELSKALGLNLEKQSVISLIGGGGKTTMLRRLQKEYEDKKIVTIATTTTHFQSLDEDWFLGVPSINKLQQILEKYGKAWCGEVTPKGKLKSLPEDFLREMTALGYTMLIEADGARRLPCKAPGPQEPVFVPETDIVLSVYGVDAVGKRITDTCFRPEVVAEIVGKNIDDVIMPSDIAVLAASEQGGKKLVTDKMEYHVIINKADGENEQRIAGKIADELYSRGVKKIYMTAGLQ